MEVPYFRDQIHNLTKSQLCELAVTLREEILQLRPDESVDVPVYQAHWQTESLRSKEQMLVPLRVLLLTDNEAPPEIDPGGAFQLQHMVLDPCWGWAPERMAEHLQNHMRECDVIAYFAPAGSALMSVTDTTLEMLGRWCTAMALAAALAEIERPPKLWLITRYGQSLPDDEVDVDVGQSPLIGLGKLCHWSCHLFGADVLISIIREHHWHRH